MAKITLKQIAPFLAGALLAASCSSSKNAVSVPDRESVKGTWVLNTVSYQGLSGAKITTLLDEGSENCVKGSTWILPNNGYGSYTINSSASACTPGQRNIVWSYQKSGDQATFQYKRLEGGVKAKDIADGYRFKILSVDASSMNLQSEVNFEGKPVYINYSFSKQ
ncbi:MAG: hypothetical protein EOO01_14135 [Chitinophagaceae bacterium]|nr:MAG: hypothetical protein EOO01_14135 [Chitinophagaceae bacterium]